MSSTTDIRAYADIAVEQGKQALEQVQSQLSHVTDAATEQASEIVGKIAAKAAPGIEGLKAAAEPYLVQALEYGSAVSDRVEELLAAIKSDKRVAKLVENAEGLTSLAVVTVQDKVIKPVLLLTGQDGKKEAAVVVESEPAPAKKTAAKKAPAKKASAKKTVPKKA